jgi:hypothetical protein
LRWRHGGTDLRTIPSPLLPSCDAGLNLDDQDDRYVLIPVMAKRASRPRLPWMLAGFWAVGDKDLAMKASALKFAPEPKGLITNMTRKQIKALPKAKS